MKRFVAALLILAAPAFAQAKDLTADDRLAIITLISSHYAQVLDAGDADAYANLFTPDGVSEWATGSAKGRARIKEWVSGLMKGGIGAKPAQVRHFVGVPDITGADDKANARTYVIIFGLSKSGSVNVPSVASYADTLVKQDGHWLFAKRVTNADLGVFGKRAD